MPQNDEYIAKRFNLLAPRVVEALNGRGYEAYYCESEKKALEKSLSLIPGNAVVSWGGSESIKELGLIAAVKERGNEVIDRDLAANPEERFEIMRKSLLCDVYLTSTNAMSADGQLVSIDGVGNRVAAQAYGPKMVLYIVGRNKIVQTVEDAVARARTYAAPVNAGRFTLDTIPCSATGACGNCKGDECMCSFIVTTRRNRVPGRAKVIIVNSNLGF